MTALISNAAVEARDKLRSILVREVNNRINKSGFLLVPHAFEVADIILEALPHLPASPDAGWRDIADAPRDGTDILLWSPLWDMTWGMQLGHFSAGEWLTGEGSVADNEPGFDPDAEVDDDHDFDSEVNTGPTHWQPLPTPPRSAS